MALLPFSSTTPLATFTRSGKVKQAVYNVMDYGADKTGVSDSTTAIQNAINAASSANGGIIYLPPGNYLLNSSALTVKNNTIIRGSGKNATILKVGASFSGVAMLYHIETLSNGSFNDWSLQDLTVDGTALSSSVRGLQVDTSAFNSILYYDLLVSNVCFQNCYIGTYQAGNNASAGGQHDNMTFMNCSYISNSFGYVMKGTYGTWIDHCLFVNNSVSAAQSANSLFAVTPSGTNPGANPATCFKMTNCDVENDDSTVDFVNGTNQGILITASMATFDNIYVSGVSQVPFAYVNQEPNEDSSLSNIKLRYAGGGLVLGAPGGGNFNTGGLTTNFTTWRCGQKSNWSSSPQRQSHVYIQSGSWLFDTGKMLIRNGDITPPYAIQVGGSANTSGLIRFTNVDIPALTDGGTPTKNYLSGIYTVSGIQNNLDIQFRNCPGVTENIIANDLQADVLQTNNLMLPVGSSGLFSLSSDGTTGNNVSVPNSSSLQFTHNCTFSVWIKPNTQAVDTVVLLRGSNTGNTCYLQMGSDNTITFAVHDSGGWSHPSSGTITTAAWHHIVMTYATGSAQIGYIDGAPAAWVDMTGRDTLAGSTQPVYIGSLYDGTTAFNGLIDDVRIWNTALTATQISELYYNVTNRTGLVGEWLFGEGSGTTANDTSGNSNTGTINGTMAYSSTVPGNTSYSPFTLPITLSVSSKSANYSLTNNDDIIKVTSSGKIITLQDAITATKKRYTIKNSSGGNISFATTSSQTVDGSTTGTIIANQSLEVVPDGSNWVIT